MGPSVGTLRKTHRKVPDHAVHTVKLGRFMFVDILTTLKNYVTVQDGMSTFVQKTCPDKKNTPFQKFRNGNVDIPV